MGDRAVISNKNKQLGVYLHWYGYREFVESILAYCDAKNYRSPDVDDEYGWARLCQVAGNTIGGTLSLGVGMFNKMDTDNWDNGTYIIEGWDIKDRLFQQYPDAKMNETMYENLKFINGKKNFRHQIFNVQNKIHLSPMIGFDNDHHFFNLMISTFMNSYFYKTCICFFIY